MVMRIDETPEWAALTAHHAAIGEQHLRQLFADDPDRGTTMTAQAGDLYLDYSKNRLTRQTIGMLVALAEKAGLRERIDAARRIADAPRHPARRRRAGRRR